MRILTHPIHTGYDYDFSRIGHQFYSMQGTWNLKHRPKPDNWHLIGEPLESYDVSVVGSYTGFEQAWNLKCPMIFNLLADASEQDLPRHVEDRADIVCFLGREVAERWRMRDSSKKRVIELGVDLDRFSGYVGSRDAVLTVGSYVSDRWEKGFMQFRDVARKVPCELVGGGNDGVPGATGEVPMEELLGKYRAARVYLNPGCVIGISVVEAMAVGMPVVTFRPINLRDAFEDGRNGFVVDTVDGAVDRIQTLLRDQALAARMGAEARRTAMARFSLERFVREWRALLDEVSGSRRGG